MPHRILVIEDEAPIRRGLVDALAHSGYMPLEAADGKAGLELALTAEYDLLLLDLMLPKVAGLEILQQLRQVRPAVAVIILTALGQEGDRVRGLKLGADDYIVKPFSVKELLARVEAVLRRSAERPSDLRRFAIPGGTADLDRCELRFDDGARCELSQREMELLRYLVRNANRAVSRDEILARVWGLGSTTNIVTRTVDMHVARLREKLRDDVSDPRVLLTVRGKGYMYAQERAEDECADELI